MRCELPTPRRCCFCIPLRIGLLIAGYIKIILSAWFLLYGSINLYVILKHVHFSEHYVTLLIILLSICNSIIDVVFHVIFLIGAHKKEYRKIRWYYKYRIFNIIAINLLFFVSVGIYLNIFILFFLLKYVIFALLLFIWTLIIEIYLLILVRSEFLKLKGNTKIQFINNEAEAQCSATIIMSSEVDEEDNDEDETDYDKILV